ncbi:unnamed protein product [Didymodactylos carnosus]|uniref:Homeobox domain-containing protein n=1 Tax=Didymodactylos carnosus TaxID=1234261 RepID=A0A813PK78_9BILA|nr:unnamed protein product [Didymodactylos carnosus]CAF0792774.1 unnamed protein product [Didymodactylos carnosus]CAF3536922.1 unnamed protein product [Didymodactylos carnosus]CAF3575504.1 unnamed protein product [Didymodactylos carnosus]
MEEKDRINDSPLSLESMENSDAYDTSRSNTPELDNDKLFDVSNRQNGNNSVLNSFPNFSPYSPLSVLSLCNSPLFLTPSPAPSKFSFNLFNRSTPSSSHTSQQRKSFNRVNFRSIDELAVSSSTPNSSVHEDSGYDSIILRTSRNEKMSSLIDNNDLCDESQDENAQISIKTVDSLETKTDSNGKKKNRTQFTDNQKWTLDRFYAKQSYPDPSQMELLSKQLSLEEKVIRVWFQNKRSRDKTRSPRFLNQSRPQTSTPTNSTPTMTPPSWPFSYNPGFFY